MGRECERMVGRAKVFKSISEVDKEALQHRLDEPG